MASQQLRERLTITIVLLILVAGAYALLQREASAGPQVSSQSTCTQWTKITTTDQYPNTATYVATQVASLPEGACIQLPDGEFAVTEPIRPRNGQTITGGRATVLALTHPRLDAFVLDGVQDVAIENLSLKGGRLRQPNNPEYNYGGTRGYGTAIRMVNVERVRVSATTIDDFFAGIDCRLGCRDLRIENNRLLVREGNTAGDQDFSCFAGTASGETSVCLVDSVGKQKVENVLGGQAIWPQTLAAFCPYQVATSSYDDCPERVGEVVTSTTVNPTTVANAAELPLLWRRPSANPSSGSPYFNLKGALINIDGERNVVEPNGSVETATAERIRISGNTLRGVDQYCDTDRALEPKHWPVPPSERTHAKRGMLLTAISDLQVESNTLSCLYFSGIALAETQRANVTNNTIRLAERGIYLFHSNDTVTVARNTIEDSVGGAGTSAAAIEIARYNRAITVDRNTLRRVLGYGIRATTPTLSASPEERLTASSITNNTVEMAIEHRTANIPLTLENGAGVTVRGNTLSNGLYGVEFRADCSAVSRGTNLYTGNRFRALESAAFHRIECGVGGIRGRRFSLQQNRQFANVKESLKLNLSRNSNEFLLQRITHPTAARQGFDWEKADRL